MSAGGMHIRAATSAIRAVCDLMTMMHTQLLLLPTSASITCNKAQALRATRRLPTCRQLQEISIQVDRYPYSWREKLPLKSMFRVRAAAAAVCKSQQLTSFRGKRAGTDCWLGCCCCLVCTACICVAGTSCCCCSSCCRCCRLSCCCCSCC